MRNTLFVIVLAYLAAVTAYAEDNSLFHFSATAGGAWGHFLEKGRSMDNSAYNFPGIPDSVGYVEIPGDRDKITGFGPAFEMKFGSDVGNFLLFVNTQFASINGEREIIMYDYKRWQDGKEYNDVVREEMEIPSRLLESVAFRIKSRLLGEFPALLALSVSVAKKNPPVGGNAEWSKVTV